jgi:hypothetical protein
MRTTTVLMGGTSSDPCDQPKRPNPQQPQCDCNLAPTNLHQPTTTPADNPPEPLRSPYGALARVPNWRLLARVAGYQRSIAKVCIVVYSTDRYLEHDVPRNIRAPQRPHDEGPPRQGDDGFAHKSHAPLLI